MVYCIETVDGDKGPLPILHISSMELPAIPDIDNWAPTELIGSDSDSSISDCDMDLSELADELKEVADGVHKLPLTYATASLTRRPLGMYYYMSDLSTFFSCLTQHYHPHSFLSLTVPLPSPRPCGQ